MTSDQQKRAIRDMAKKDGTHHITRLLVIEGLSYSLAYQLCEGKYVSDLKSKTMQATKKVIEQCLKK